MEASSTEQDEKEPEQKIPSKEPLRAGCNNVNRIILKGRYIVECQLTEMVMIGNDNDNTIEIDPEVRIVIVANHQEPILSEEAGGEREEG